MLRHQHLEDETLRTLTGLVFAPPPLEKLHERFKATAERNVLVTTPIIVAWRICSLPSAKVTVGQLVHRARLDDGDDIDLSVGRDHAHRALVNPLDREFIFKGVCKFLKRIFWIV